MNQARQSSQNDRPTLKPATDSKPAKPTKPADRHQAIRKRTNNRTEEAEQARLVRWSHKPAVRAMLPELRWLHHSPNGGQRNKVTGAQMKALGTKPGWPDLVLPVARGEYAGLAIEMKSARGRLTAEQEAWLAHFEAQGWLVLVVRAAEQARRLVCSYLGASADALPGLDVSQKAGGETNAA